MVLIWKVIFLIIIILDDVLLFNELILYFEIQLLSFIVFLDVDTQREFSDASHCTGNIEIRSIVVWSFIFIIVYGDFIYFTREFLLKWFFRSFIVIFLIINWICGFFSIHGGYALIGKLENTTLKIFQIIVIFAFLFALLTSISVHLVNGINIKRKTLVEILGFLQFLLVHTLFVVLSFHLGHWFTLGQLIRLSALLLLIFQLFGYQIRCFEDELVALII